MLRNLMQEGIRGAVLAVVLSIPVGLTIGACTQLQQVQQLPLDQRLKLAYETHALLTGEVAAALEAKTISVGTAKAYLELAEGSRKVLDEARGLLGVDVSTAEARLALARDILERARIELLKGEAK